MKTIIRISLEVIVISVLVVFLNNAFTQESKITSGPKPVQTEDLIGVSKSVSVAKDLQMVSFSTMYNYLAKSGYTSGNNLFPIMGYDPKNKKLIPLTTTLNYTISKNPMRGEDVAFVLTGFRDSVTSSYDDLEKRVTRLENKVAQIEKECCPKK